MTERLVKIQFFKKRAGAIQFELLLPVANEKGYLEEGAVYVEAAQCLPEQDKCNWTHKARMSLGFVDLSHMLTALRNPTVLDKSGNLIDLIHKTEITSSRLTVTPGTPGTFKLFISSQKTGEDKHSLQIYLDRHEMVALLVMVERALYRIVGW